MNKIIASLLIILSILFITLIPTVSASAESAADCGKNTTFFGLPTWYKYLNFDSNCNIELTQKVVESNGTVNQSIDFEEIWLIALAIIEILLTLAGILAVVYVIVGGFKYVTSQAEPEKLTSAKNTIVNALVGVVIAIVASQVIAFVAAKLSSGSASLNGISLPNANTSSSGFMAILNYLFLLLGSISFLVVTYGGILLSTSHGESQKISKARNTILFALVGLGISIFAALIVNFVIGKVT